MDRKTGPLLFVLFLFPLLLGAESYRIVPNYGHLDRVITMDYDGEREILLTLGRDQFCLAVDLKENRVMNRIALPGIPLLIRRNPLFPEAAVLSETGSSYTLTLFDWQTGETLYEKGLEGVPFFLEYSRSGEILQIGNGGIVFIDHATGETRESPSGITDLLSFGYLGGTEKTFMGYSPSGDLIYYDRFTSEIRGRAKTLEDLTDLAVCADDVRLMTGRRDNTVYLIDRQAGKTLDTLEEPQILSYHCQSDRGLITIMTDENGEIGLSAYTVRNSRFRRETEKTVQSGEEPSFALYNGGAFILGTEMGNFQSTGKRGTALLSLLPARPLIVDRLAINDNRLILGGDGKIKIWESPFFEESGLSLNYLLNLTTRTFPDPLGESRFAPFGSDEVLWKGDERTKYPYYVLKRGKDIVPLFEPAAQGEPKKDFGGFAKEITFGFRELSFYGDREVVLDENRNCRVNRLEEKDGTFLRTELFNYTHPSLETAAMVSENHLALGINTYFGGSNSINLTDIFTGETIPLSDERVIVTAFLPDDGGTGFYSLGFADGEGGSRCVVKHHDLSDLFAPGETVLEFPQPIGNDCPMTQRGGRVFVTTPDGEWYRSDGAGSQPATYSLDRVIDHDGYLYSLDRDHSLIISGEERGETLVKVYFFDNGEWLALSPGTRFYFHSVKARGLFTVYRIDD